MILRVSSLKAFVSIVFLSVLILQVTRSLYVDAYSLQGARKDLIGYWIDFALGILMLGYAWRENLIRKTPLIFIGILYLFICINIELNTDQSSESVLFSRYGMLLWLCLGMSTSIALIWVRARLGSGLSRFKSILISGWVFILSIPMAMLAQQIIADTPKTFSYQPVASSGIIAISLAILALFAFEQRQSSSALRLPIYALLILGSLLVYAIALLQSMGIIAFWAAAVPIILLTEKKESSRLWRIISGAMVAVGLIWMANNFLLEELMQKTRLSDVSDGITSVSSVNSRMLLLKDFLPQFEVAPIFGDFEAEVRAGFDPGEYIHSLPLSLLTHTGIVGFSLFFSAWALLFGYEFGARKQADTWLVLRLRLFIAVTILATLYAFFTWQVMWFFMGLLCIKHDSHVCTSRRSR